MDTETLSIMEIRFLHTTKIHAEPLLADNKPATRSDHVIIDGASADAFVSLYCKKMMAVVKNPNDMDGKSLLMITAKGHAAHLPHQ